MPVPNTSFGTATSAIPLSELDANFATPITLGNTAIQLGNTVTTLNNMTLANVTISSGNVTITNVGITTANVSGTANISTLAVVGNATVGGNTTITGNITAANANVTTNLVLSNGTANGVAYLNTSKVLTTGSTLYWDGTFFGVGTNGPNRKLYVQSDDSVTGGNVVGVRNSNATAGAFINFLAGGSNAPSVGAKGDDLVFNADGYNGAEWARFSSGNLLVGKTSFSGISGTGAFVAADGRINVVNAADTNAFTTYELYSTNAGAYRFYVGSAGTIFATSIVITAISDQRLKENVRDIDTGLSSIMALKPRRFDWKEGKGQDKKNVAGFIAQEFEDVFPECVGASKAGGDGIEYKNINHETLIPTLVKAIQEQQALIQTLTARITALEGA